MNKQPDNWSEVVNHRSWKESKMNQPIKETVIKSTRRHINQLSLGIIIYTVIANAAVIGAMLISIIMFNAGQALGGTGQSYDDFVDKMSSSATSTIAGFTFAALFIVLYNFLTSDTVSMRTIYRVKRKMSFKVFIQILCVFMAGQLVFTGITNLMEYLLNTFGYSMMSSIEAASSTTDSISMTIYAGFGAPLFEEFTYRGFLGKNLEKHSKIFAIVVSSLFFGLMHGNLAQIPFAFAVGIVLGYVALEYSIWYSMLLHFINNFIFGDLMTRLLTPFGDSVMNAVSYGLFGVFAAAAVVVLILHRKGIAAYIKENKAGKGQYKALFTSICFILFAIAELVTAVMFIEPL